jgi:hypothetical protein
MQFYPSKRKVEKIGEISVKGDMSNTSAGQIVLDSDVDAQIIWDSSCGDRQ